MVRIAQRLGSVVVVLGLALLASGAHAAEVVVTAATPSPLAVSAVSGANADVTATLPAVANQFHYITAMQVIRACPLAIVGTAALTLTSANLPGSLGWSVGNACIVGGTNPDLNLVFISPLRSSVVNTATTITCPAIGASGICRVNVIYYTAP